MGKGGGRQAGPVLVGAVLMALAVTACSPETPTEAPPYDLSFDMKQFMSWVLEPAAEGVWDAAGVVVTYAGEESLYPTDEEGWASVAHAGAAIVEAGNSLMLPGRAEDQEAWYEFSLALATVGHEISAAAQAQDEDRLFAEGGKLYNVCVACHQIYAPEVRAK